MDGPVLSRQARTVARRIRLQSRRQVEAVLAGAWQSAFHGAGLDFHQVREYVAGDDVRRLDPMSSARTGRWYLREFQEERQQHVMLLLDVSASTRRGASGLARERMAELAGILALAAVTSGDTCGALLLGEEVEEVIRPCATEDGALQLVPRVLAAAPRRPGTCLDVALRQARAFLPRRALVFLVSDFLDRDFEPALRALARRHEVVLAGLWEDVQPLAVTRARLALRDPESAAGLELDLVGSVRRAALVAAMRRRTEALAALARSAGAQWMPLPCEQPAADAILSFLARRSARERLR